MKILMSPSKTKVLSGTPAEAVFDEATSRSIVAHIQTLEEGVFAKALKLKADKGAEWYEFYQAFLTQPLGTAIESYSGLAFKNLDWQGLDEKAKAFGAEHLCILSALYGMVRPLSGITNYRLDFVDTIYKGCGTSLYEIWSGPVNAALAQEDWILNLASKEYAKLIDHPYMLTVEFLENKNGVWKQLSTSSKQMRGRFGHYVLSHGITNWQDLPKAIDDFVLDSPLPAELTEPITISYKRNS